MPHLSSSDFDLVLASSSPRRMEILNQLGVRYQAVSPMIDESLRYGESGEEYVRRLALDKASALAMHELSPPILGADTAIVCRDEVFGKPQNFEQFKEMKKSVFKSQKNKILKFSNLKITPYPSKNNNLYRVSFDEFFQSWNNTFKGKKILYLQLINNRISIFLEN